MSAAEGLAAPAPFGPLTPDFVLAAVESAGLRCDGRLLTLNSYENRVYQVGIEDASPLVAKFYRPGRWDDAAAILEDEEAARRLAGRDKPSVAVQELPGMTLRHFGQAAHGEDEHHDGHDDHDHDHRPGSLDAHLWLLPANARVIAANPGAPSRRELYDAVLRSRQG